MAFADDLAAAQTSGKPFAISRNVVTGEASVVYLSQAEIDENAARKAQFDARVAAEQTARSDRLAKLRAAFSAEQAQFIEDELL